MKLGERIKKRRLDLKFSQEELAQRLGYTSRSSINKIESGRNDISQSKVIEFAEVLQTTPMYLMGVSDDPTSCKSEYENYKRKQAHRLKMLQDITGSLFDLPEEKLTQIKDFVDFVKTK